MILRRIPFATLSAIGTFCDAMQPVSTPPVVHTPLSASFEDGPGQGGEALEPSPATMADVSCKLNIPGSVFFGPTDSSACETPVSAEGSTGAGNPPPAPVRSPRTVKRLGIQERNGLWQTQDIAEWTGPTLQYRWDWSECGWEYRDVRSGEWKPASAGLGDVQSGPGFVFVEIVPGVESTVQPAMPTPGVSSEQLDWLEHAFLNVLAVHLPFEASGGVIHCYSDLEDTHHHMICADWPAWREHTWSVFRGNCEKATARAAAADERMSAAITELNRNRNLQ